jgi:small subunit ribosomal protein S7
MGSLSYIQSLPLVCQAKAPEKEARSGKEVAVHLNGQTATSFLMAVHQNEQPPLFQALHTGSSQPPLSALHLRAGLLARHTCEALLPDSRAHISNAPTLSRVFEKRNGGLRRTPWAVGRADFLTVPVSGVQANRQQTTTLVSAGGLLVQQTAPIYATQANKQQSSILFLSAAGLRVPVSRSVHLCSFVFVSALRVVKCSRDLHRRATHLSARNTSGESLTYMRELNDSQQRCLQKFINICMVDGKKTKSHLILTNTFARLANYGDVVAFVMNAIENVKPIIEIKKVRISGSTQMVPSLISKRRQETLAIRWIVEAALQRRKAKQSFNLEQCLFAEIVDASNKVGVVRKKRDELHKLAEANRGFAHYRWW